MAVIDSTTPDEVWYPIPGFPGYEFSSDWRVRSFHSRRPGGGIRSDRWVIKKSRPMKSGYLYYQLNRDGKNHFVYVHHLVAMLAYGPTPDDLNILHGDDTKSNNFPSNLSFGTVADNARDAIANKKWRLGSERSSSKVNEDTVREIRRLARSGVFQRDIGAKFGINQALVSRIVSRQRWPHVS